MDGVRQAKQRGEHSRTLRGAAPAAGRRAERHRQHRFALGRGQVQPAGSPVLAGEEGVAYPDEQQRLDTAAFGGAPELEGWEESEETSE